MGGFQSRLCVSLRSVLFLRARRRSPPYVRRLLGRGEPQAPAWRGARAGRRRGAPGTCRYAGPTHSAKLRTKSVFSLPAS